MTKTASARATPRETLNLRIPAGERRLIDRAAASSGKTRTDFILGAARRAAEEALLDRSVLRVDSKAFQLFLDNLAVPPAPSERLCRTMRQPPPWPEG